MKTINADSIYLKGGSYYITQEGTDAYRILKGSVYVYIVPWDKNGIGRRALLCQMNERETIPAFSYRDLDYQSWRFCFVAVEEAVIQHLPGMLTSPLKKRFLEGAGIKSSGKENFENLLVDFYHMSLIKEDAYLIRTEREKMATKEKTDRLIASVFSERPVLEKQESGQVLYEMVAILCHKAKIPIASFEKVQFCCGKFATVFDIARVSHFPCREVVLEEGWHKADAGALLVYLEKDGEPAACIPNGAGGYLLQRNGQKPVRLTKKLSEQCSPKAYMIYRSLPQKELSGKDFFTYCLKGLNYRDLCSVLLLTAVTSLIGLLVPSLYQKLYDEFIPMGSSSLIIQICSLMIAFMMGNIAFSIVKSIGGFRLSSHIRYQTQNAVYHRVFELPENFFRKYESADLARRIMELGSLASDVADMILSVFVSVLVSFFYLWRMFAYSGRLSLAALVLMILFAAIIYGLSDWQMRYGKQIMELEGKSDSVMYQFLQGIEKIRIAGIEERTVYECMKPYVEQRKIETKMGKVSGINGIVMTVGGTLITMVMYAIAYADADISMGQFVAFNAAYGMVFQTVNDLVKGWIGYRMLKPAYDRVRPVLETMPEVNDGKQMPGTITGEIDVSHVAFSYDENAQMVFEDLTLHIRSGEYVGLVGASGCGKSTLLKLLLGFEKPASGAIYYNNQDLAELDLQELRKQFGVVLQDGELISGSIYENITLTVKEPSLELVQETVNAVGLAKDIEEMPMGLHTIVSENCNTISGGQKQRVLIARAIINQPAILFFDEATSALDNITQSMVCDTLQQMDCTKVVIAHRLTTIQNCDRIIVLDQGKIVEEGSYQTLMEKKGLFHKLASRQMI